MSQDDSVNRSGMYISQDMLNNKDMKRSIDQYSADHGNVVLLNVELKQNPYSKSAFKTLNNIKNTIDNQKTVLYLKIARLNTAVLPHKTQI